MKIVLEKTDIENMVKERYKGVTDIRFNSKAVKITLEVDSAAFTGVKAIKTFPIREDQMKPVERPPKPMSNEERAKKGVMAQGGRERTLQHIGWMFMNNIYIFSDKDIRFISTSVLFIILTQIFIILLLLHK